MTDQVGIKIKKSAVSLLALVSGVGSMGASYRGVKDDAVSITSNNTRTPVGKKVKNKSKRKIAKAKAASRKINRR